MRRRVGVRVRDRSSMFDHHLGSAQFISDSWVALDFFTVWFRQGLEGLVSGIGAMDSRLHRIFAGGNSSGGAHSDSPLVDSSEQVYISSLALLKMLKHDMVEF